MSPVWIGLCVFIWILGAILGSIPVGENLIGNLTVTKPVQVLMSYGTTYSQGDWGSLLVPSFHLSFFQSVFKILVLDLPLFGPPDSPWQIFRWIFLAPIVATVVFGLVTLFISIFTRNV